jgi:alpha-methylacyl-CoA racemase
MSTERTATGPLSGLRIVELAGLGPAPFCGMLLADMGADVVRIDRPPESGERPNRTAPLWDRGRRSVALDLKDPAGPATVLRMLEKADALIEGFRPGVMERLGLGPDVCLHRNRRLVYGRVTGWGQDGPLAQKAGHDINFIAVAGVLASIGRSDEPPVPPLNLVGDFGGGGMLLALGVCAALLSARTSGQGQVVDAAMAEGSAQLMTSIYGERQLGHWVPRRGANLFDSGAPFYDVYETKDHEYVAVGALEKRFYAELLEGLGLAGELHRLDRMDPANWGQLRLRFQEVFLTRTRQEWASVFGELEACTTPVLSMDEAALHPQSVARTSFVTYDDALQPAPAPRFSHTPSAIARSAPRPGQHTAEVLEEWGIEV